MDTVLSLRVAEDETDAVLIFRAFCMMHAEGGLPGVVDKVKTLTNVVRMVREPGFVVLMVMDGENLAGVLSLTKITYWFNHDSFFEDKGFYVLPAYRNGEAFDMLLDMARQASDDQGIPVYITINNGQRKRGGRSKWERRGLTLGYHPQGAVLAHFSGE